MKTPENAELLTVGQLTEDLAEFEEERSDHDVVCWTPDHDPCYLTSMQLDEDGDLCLALREDDGDNYDVATMLEELGEFDSEARVYVAARGLYMTIQQKSDGTIFAEDSDVESDIDLVACQGVTFGTYDEEDEGDPLAEDDKKKGQPAGKVHKSDIIIGLLLLLLFIYVIYYLVSSAIAVSGTVKGIFLVVGCCVIGFILVTAFELLFGKLFGAKPPKDSPEHVIELSEKGKNHR